MTDEPQQLDLEDYIEEQGGKRGSDFHNKYYSFKLHQWRKKNLWGDDLEEDLKDHGLKIVLDKDQ